MRYIALIDGKPGAYGVVFPDLPGCTAMAADLDGALVAATEALGEWVRTVEVAGGKVPPPSTAEALRQRPEVAEALADGASFATLLVVRHTGKPVRANLSLDEGVVLAIDAAAAQRGVTRSAMVEIIARQLLPELA
jgi:predicted RNase H-like HicB family nuclease